MALHERLNFYRRKKGYSQEEVAAKMGVSNKTVSHWETNRTRPNDETVAKLADIYGVQLSTLLSEERPLRPDTMRAVRGELNASPPITALISAVCHLVYLVHFYAPYEHPLSDGAELVEKALGRVRDSLPDAEREQATRLIQDVARRFAANEQSADVPPVRRENS